MTAVAPFTTLVNKRPIAVNLLPLNGYWWVDYDDSLCLEEHSSNRCRWSNDKYLTFFTMEYPDVESAIMDTTGVEEAGLFRYMVSETILGIEEGTAGATS